jgi:hypothetical protein
MSRDPSKTINSSCTTQGAALTLSFDAAEVVQELKAALEKRLLKKGIALRWVEETASPEILIRVVSIDQGNQFLRWLLPFISPAVLEVEGQVAVAGAGPRPFHYVKKAQMGLAGGSAKGMLKVCATRTADKIADDVLRALPT